MNAMTVRRAAAVIGAGSVALIIAQVALEYVGRHAALPAGWQEWDFPDVFGDLVNLAVPVVGLVLATRRPGNRIGWLFLAAGLAVGLGGFGGAYGLHALRVAPGSLPAGQAGVWVSNWIWVIPFAALGFLFLLFPAGRLRTRRWRPAAWVVGTGFAALALDLLVSATLIWSHPFGSSEPAFPALVVVIPSVSLVISVAAVITRYARSAGEERLQLKWFAAAAASPLRAGAGY